jgi:hypothetical protein
MKTPFYLTFSTGLADKIITVMMNLASLPCTKKTLEESVN